MPRRLSFGTLAAALALPLLGTGCRQDMHDQPRYKPFAKSDFFADGRSERPLVPGTVARGWLRADTRLETGKDGAAFTAEFPVRVDLALVKRGRERFDIFCAPCHGRTGVGNGMVVQRGYRKPTSFHIDRLRHEKPGYFFDVITHGFGAMPDYASQIPVRDRWAIVAYVRALQLSQYAGVDDVTAEQRTQMDAMFHTAPEANSGAAFERGAPGPRAPEPGPHGHTGAGAHDAAAGGAH